METEESLSTEKKAKKNSPARQKEVDQLNKIDNLEERIEGLEYTIRMMAHFNGTNRVLDECKLDRWEPSKRHLKRA